MRVSDMATQLGITTQAVYVRMRKLGIKLDRLEAVEYTPEQFEQVKTYKRKKYTRKADAETQTQSNG